MLEQANAHGSVCASLLIGIHFNRCLCLYVYLCAKTIVTTLDRCKRSRDLKIHK